MAEDTQPLLGVFPVSECINQDGDTFGIAEFAKQKLQRLQVSQPEGNWAMTLKLGGVEWPTKGEIESLTLNPVVPVNSQLGTKREVKLELENFTTISAEFDQTFRHLGKLLFPAFTGDNGNQNLEIVEKSGDYQIQRIEKSVETTPPAFPWQSSSEVPTRENYSYFVNSLFESLNDLAWKSQFYKAAGRHIDDAAKGSGKESPEEMIQRWKQLAEKSKEEGWSREDRFSVPSASKTNSEAKRKLEVYSADLYFTAFFKEWESVFSNDEKTSRLIEYLRQPTRLNTVASSGELDRQIEQLESLLKQLQSDNILKQLQVSFSYIWEESKPNSPDKVQKSFLVLQGEPDDAN